MFSTQPNFAGMPVVQFPDNAEGLVFIDFDEKRSQERSVQFSTNGKTLSREDIALDQAVSRCADSLLQRGYFNSHAEAMSFVRQNGNRLSRPLDKEPIRATADLREKISRVAEARLAADPALVVMEVYSEVEARFLDHLRR